MGPVGLLAALAALAAPRAVPEHHQQGGHVRVEAPGLAVERGLEPVPVPVAATAYGHGGPVGQGHQLQASVVGRIRGAEAPYLDGLLSDATNPSTCHVGD